MVIVTRERACLLYQRSLDALTDMLSIWRCTPEFKVIIIIIHNYIATYREISFLYRDKKQKNFKKIYEDTYVKVKLQFYSYSKAVDYMLLIVAIVVTVNIYRSTGSGLCFTWQYFSALNHYVISLRWATLILRKSLN